jgi:hypothetical protein
MSVRQRMMMYFLGFTHTLMIDLFLLLLGSGQSSVGLSIIPSLSGTRRTDWADEMGVTYKDVCIC